jgi:hypothetical protein
MMRLLFTAILLLLVRTGDAQIYVSFSYQEEPLQRVIRDLEARYPIRFSYSSSVVPLDYPISARTGVVPLQEGLAILFASSPFVYAFIDEQIALRYDAARDPRLITSEDAAPQREQRPPTAPDPEPPPEPVVTEAAPEPEPEPAPPPRPAPEPVTPIASERPRTLFGGSNRPERYATDTIGRIDPRGAAPRDYRRRRLFQASLLPGLGTNVGRAKRTINTISINILAGLSGGLAGAEIGGLLNMVDGQADGAQFAGLGNFVSQDLTGLQVAGVGNIVGGQTRGLQLAGLFNVGIDTVAGTQLAGLANVGGSRTKTQISGGFNLSNGKTRRQLAPLFNIARDVERRQVSFLFNGARRVGRGQLALINYCDTVAGASVGLLNIVRKGYNRVELSANEFNWANLGFKLGGDHFYNVFHFGARWDEDTLVVGSVTEEINEMTWLLGYGFGNSIRMGGNSRLNVELVAQHVNERERWTDELHLLSQFRMNIEFGSAGAFQVFVGPTFNVLFSERVDPDTGEIGSAFVPENTLFDQQNGATRIQGWIGVTGGIRLGK